MPAPIPAGMKTRAEKIDGGYRLTGAKTWISNSPIADVFVVWAKSAAHDDAIRGFVLEKGMKGLSAPKIGGKLSLRASITGEIVMDGVEVAGGRAAAERLGAEGPVRLPQPRALRHLLGLRWARPKIAGIGARQYALDRKQFGRPLAADPARPEEARRHADRDRARAAGVACASAGCSTRAASRRR